MHVEIATTHADLSYDENPRFESEHRVDLASIGSTSGPVFRTSAFGNRYD